MNLHESPENALTVADRIYCWSGPKMGMTVFSAKLGRLVLTNHRLLFLSSGSSGGAGLVARAAISPALALRGQATGGLDLSALANEGSLSIPLHAVTGCELGKKRALVIRTLPGPGGQTAFTFGEKMGMPGREVWVRAIEQQRAAFR